ncbi:hypothetical protein MLD38_014034 [Melastoma candidum]|uniref:Uncharacterized protein n=1 Tax=Melastoma candidum TaxID=119954 RepID=A0ACB9RF52_9MYRT|nr:hypothetical protein MLD38_014034 [Melastoma candidum]
MEKLSVIGRLKRAVKKVRLLIDFSIARWRIASLIGGRGAASSGRRRPLSFNDRPGLMYYTAGDESESEQDPGSARWSTGGGGIQRTLSYPSEEDVDGRAEAFISNFYRQLRMERQVSLELRYCRGGRSFDSSTSP